MTALTIGHRPPASPARPAEPAVAADISRRPAPAARPMGGQHTLLSASAALVGAISYAATLLMAHLLPVDGYTDYAAVVSLLGTVGVASSALVPLPLAAVVRAHPAGSLQRRRAMSFALTVAVLAGVLAAGALAAITSTFASTAVVAAAAAAGFALLLIGVGTGRTRLTRVLGYMLLLPAAARRRPADLVVEDFFAPISTMAAPLWTGRPTIGVVQWLNARQKARQYHLPLHLIERAGVRRHHHLIAMSNDLAHQLHAMNPRVTTTVIGNGVDPAAFHEPARIGEDIVFVGRLETAQKGLDLLLIGVREVSSLMVADAADLLIGGAT